MNKNFIDTIINYLQTDKCTKIEVIGHSETKTTFHNINKDTKEKYLINVFKCDSFNCERPIDIYDNQIEAVYYNKVNKTIKIKLKEW